MDTLQKHKNEPLFDVPEHYFNELQYDVMQRIAKEGKRRSFYRKWMASVSIAASFALIFLLSYFIFVNRSFENNFYAFEEINPQENTPFLEEANYFVETIENIVEIPCENTAKTKTQPQTTTETIFYSAVEFYVDDYTTSNFCEVMFDLECYFDY